MKKYVLMLLAPLWLTGCPPLPGVLPPMGVAPPGIGSTEVLATTAVGLSKKNYRIVKVNAVGVSRGFSLLGILPLKSASYFRATERLYQDAGISEGKAQAMANMVYQKRAPFFILFSLPTIILHADLVEFVEEPPLERNVDSLPEVEVKASSREKESSFSLGSLGSM
jgi:hypothetical protein